MDCQNFKELLDSYLCGELAVETNHTMLCHAERCCSCRGEMAARRSLRASLRRVCSKEMLSDQAMEKLRASLRAECGSDLVPAGTGGATGRRNRFARLFKMRFLATAANAAALALFIGAAWGLYILWRGGANHQRLSSEQIKALELSASLVAESAGDHRFCAPYFVNATGPAEMPDSVREYDLACVRLDKIAAAGADELLLRSAHICDFKDRKFAHLVYTRGASLVSLLVTVRDCRALKSGAVPPFSGPALGAQQFTHDHLALGAYQTSKRIVLVVSDLPENENAALAEKLVRPVVEHLRNVESATGPKERVGIGRSRGEVAHVASDALKR
ncbi:MAG TPA: hypothetical protein VJ810_38860 [Blastocatellia bacterium]|nr:hypothetical protein [Blastocatellia bacterium]